MIIISNLKQKFGQDLPYVQRRIAELNTILNRLLLEPIQNEKEISYTRGKLLKYMKHEIDLTQDPNLNQQQNILLNFEINKHKQQLTNRIRSNKRSNHNKISTEIGLKIQRTVSSYKQVALSNNKKELVGNIAKSTGNTISTIGSIAKIPTIGVTKILKASSKLTAKILTLPLHIPNYLFSKLINPEAPYKGMVVKNISHGLEELLKVAMEKQEEIIRRI